MRSATLRFVQFWIGLVLLCAGVLLAAAWTLGAVLAPAERTRALELLDAAGTLPYVFCIALVAALGFLAAWLVGHFVRPLAAGAEAVLLAAHVNAAHRLPRQGARELRQLIDAVNVLAERHHAAIEAGDARAQEALRAQEAERNRLAVLISELPQGVIVCNADGLILLYNEQARALLCRPDGDAFLGLGRSVYHVVQDGALREATARLTARDAGGEIDPATDLTLHSGGTGVRLRIAPVAGGADPTAGTTAPAGFVLLLERSGSLPHVRRPAPSAPQPAGARPVFYDFDLFRHSAGGAALDERLLRELAYTVFDTETTGLDPAAGDEIVSIGAVRIVNGRLVPGDTFDCLVDPGRPVGKASTRIHGLTDAMLQGQPSIARVLPRFHAFCADTILVGHNIAFDLRFLQLKEAATGVRFQQPVLDTLLLSAVLHEHLADDRLEAIAHRLGIEALARHTALGDATMAAQAFIKMLPLLAAQGVTTLRAALEASSRTRYARLRY